MEIPITPMGAVRTTQNSLWSPNYQKYAQWKDDLKIVTKSLRYEIKEPLSITFVLPVPKSISKKERELRLGNMHRQKPDLDNMIKAFVDALLTEDAALAEYGPMKKVWGVEGKIIIN